MTKNTSPILITGAAGAIGGNLAQCLATKGNTPILLDKDEKGLELLYDKIVKDSGVEPVMVVSDLTRFSAGEAERLANETAVELGDLQGFIHCACTWPLASPSLSIPPNALEQAFQVQVHSAWLLFQVFAAQLLETRGKTLISTWTLNEDPAYQATLFSIDSALRALIAAFVDEHKDHAKFIEVIDPGPVQSPLYRTLYPGQTLDELPNIDSVVNRYMAAFSLDNAAVSTRLPSPSQ